MASKGNLRLIRSEPIGDDLAGCGAVKSAKRVLEIFEFFAERQAAATVGEVVDALGWPQSSTSNLLKSLVQLRYLAYDGQTRSFLPTMRIALLGGWVHDKMFSSISLVGLLETLRATTGHTVLLGMQNDIWVQYIHVILADLEDWYIKSGSLRPLCRAAVGRVLLTLKSDVDVLGLARRINAEESNPERYIRSGELLAELDLIRRQGYAYTEGTVIPNNGVIAVELPTPASQAPLAIGIGCPIPLLRRDRDKIVSLLQDAVRPYSHASGA